MKKSFWTKMLSLMLVLVCVISMTACGSKKSDVIGAYKLQTIEMEGVSMDIEELVSYLGEEGEEGADLNIILDIQDGGKFKLDMSSLDDSLSGEGTWEEADGKLKLTVEGETIEATLKDGVITMAEEGTSMTFAKQK